MVDRDVTIRVNVVNGQAKLGPLDTSGITEQIKTDIAAAVGSAPLKIPSASKILKMSDADIGSMFGIDYSSGSSSPLAGKVGGVRSRSVSNATPTPSAPDNSTPAWFHDNNYHNSNPNRRSSKPFNFQEAVPAPIDEPAPVESSPLGATSGKKGSSTAIVTAINKQGTAIVSAVNNINPPSGITPAPMVNPQATPPPLPKKPATPPPLPKKPSNPFFSLEASAGLLTAFSASLKAAMVVIDEVRNLEMAMIHQEVNDVQRAQTEYLAKTNIEAGSHSRLADQMFDQAGSSRYLRNIQGRDKTEASVRGIEATDMTGSQKAFMRNRAMTEQGDKERKVAIDEELNFNKKRQKEYSTSATHYKALEEHTRNAHTTTQGAIRAKQQFIRDNPSNKLLGRHHVDEVKTMDELSKQLRADRKSEEQEILALKERQNEAQSKGVELGLKNNSLLAEKHSITKKQQQDAYVAVRDEKENLRNSRIGLGALDFGDQQRLLIVQNKHKRIQAQKAKNKDQGRDEWEGVESMTQDEIQESLSSGVGAQSAKQQAERQAKKLGLETEEVNEKTLKEKEDHAREINSKIAVDEKSSTTELDKSNLETNALAKRMVDSMKGAFAQQALVAEVERQLGELANQVQVNDVKRGMVSLSFFR